MISDENLKKIITENFERYLRDHYNHNVLKDNNFYKCTEDIVKIYTDYIIGKKGKVTFDILSEKHFTNNINVLVNNLVLMCRYYNIDYMVWDLSHISLNTYSKAYIKDKVIIFKNYHLVKPELIYLLDEIVEEAYCIYGISKFS